MCCSADGRLVASATAQRRARVCVWDAGTGQEVRIVTLDTAS
jgi:hypothetical protein